MRARIVLPVLLVLGGALLVTLLSQDSGGRASGSSRPDARDLSAAGPETGPPAQAPPALSLAPEAEQERPSRVAAPIAGDAQSADRNFVQNETRSFSVRVALPLGVPAEDGTRVVVFARNDTQPWTAEDAAVATRELGRGSVARYLADRQGLWWDSAPVTGSGSYELELPAEATNALALLDSHYVRADAALLEPGEPAPTLDGTLGAWLTGTVTQPGTTPVQPMGPVGTRKVMLLGRGTGGFFRPQQLDSYEAPVGEDGAYEARGLDPESRYLVRVEAQGRVDVTIRSLRVEPGEHKALDLALEVGAIVRGKVVAEDGTVVPGAAVMGTATGSLLMRQLGGAEETEVDKDGSFVLAGLPPGKVRLVASADGFQDTEPLELELGPEEEATDLRLVLRRGGILRGQVRWADGRPATGAEVSTVNRTRRRWGGGRSNTVRAFAKQDGSFLLGGLADGPFVVTAEARPQTDADGFDEDQTEDVIWFARAEGVAVNSTDLVLVLQPPGEVSGRVVDDTGAPVTSFRVRVTKSDASPWERGTSHDFEDEEGRFTLDGLAPGSWTVRAEADGYSASEETPPTVELPGDVAPLELVLRRALRVEGRVVDPSGAPVADATVEYAERFRMRSVPCDPEGRFTFEGLPAGGVSLVAKSASWAESEPVLVTGEPGEALQDVELRLRVGVTVTGEVYDAEGRPDAGAVVAASGASNDLFEGNTNTTTDGSGSFRLEHVPPGKIRVTAMPGEDRLFEGLEGAENEEEAMVAVLGSLRSASVEAEDGAEVSVTLGFPAKKPVEVTGSVLEGGRGVAGASLLVSEAGSALGGMRSAHTDASGRYAITVNRPGDYVFRVRLEGRAGAPVPFPVTVPDAESFELDLALPTGVLAGTVLASDGSPAPGVQVRLRRPGGSFSPWDLDPNAQVASATDGSFRIDHLAAGSYALEAGGPTFGGETSAAATVVLSGLTLDEGQVRGGLVLQLEEPGTLRGTVRAADGTPIAGASVFVHLPNGEPVRVLSSAQSDASGKFRVAGLPAGELTASARKGDLASPMSAPVRVSPEAEATVDLQIAPGSTLLVRYEFNGERRTASIDVFDEAGRRMSGLATPDSFGELFAGNADPEEDQRVGPLPPGTYRVEARDSEGHTASKRVTLDGRRPERKVRLRGR